MNSTEFLNEVKNSNICPENFEEIYKEFQGYQNAALETLKEVHRVCEKNAIPYQLAYGSLLGLIRDGGQIPWDYDIDIIVPYEQKKALINALNEDLGKEYYFYCPENNDKCRHMIMRVAPEEFKSEALHVDVFFLTGSPDDKEEREKYIARIKELAEKRFGKLVNIKEESVGELRSALRLLRRKLPVMFTNLKKAYDEFDTLCSSYSSSASKYCISADSFADWKDVPSALLWETKIVECDYGEIRIPVHYDELLTLFYGDYKSVPPLENRIKEVICHHKRIKTFQSAVARKSNR